MLGPCRIKHLLPPGVKLALNRKQRVPTQQQNRLKCATLYDCYEYGLETLANLWQTRHRTDVGTCLPANQNARKKEVVPYACRLRDFLLPSHLVLLICHAVTKKLKFLIKKS